MQYKDLPKNNKVCVMPWRGAYMTTGSEVLPCCLTSANHWKLEDFDIRDSLRKHNIDSIRNSDAWNSLRKDLISGIENPTCEFCWQKERKGFQSNRTFSNQHFPNLIDDIDFNQDGSLDNNNISYWDVRSTNLCNMKCVMCGPGLSSLWNEEALKNYQGTHKNEYYFKPIGDTAVFYANNNVGETIESIVERNIDYVDTFYFAGGEPLINNTHWKILELLIERKMFHVKLIYNTNLLKLDYGKWNALSVWENFESVEVCASIDAIGSRAEYSRTGTVWSTVDKNFRTIQKERPHQTGLNPTTSVLTIGGMQEFLNWADDCQVDKNRIQLSNVLLSPGYLSIDILPQKIKDIYWKNIEDSASLCGKNGFNILKERMLTNKFDIEKQQEKQLQFKRTMKILDDVRNNSILHGCPDLIDFLNSITQ
jgi:organic radical activating enzyme